MPKLIDLTGQKFGRLTVIKRYENNIQNKKVLWECKCDCGKSTIVQGGNLRNGHTRSCGCLIPDSYVIKHGMTDTRLFHIWNGMKARCYRKSAEQYKNYGGRGITICDEWLGDNGFINFYNWSIGNGYKDDLTIDRIDNNKGYSPDNCRWVSRKIQSLNRRNTLFFTYNGKTKPLIQWCEEYNMDYRFVWQRIFVLNWDFEKAISTPKKI